MGRASCSVGYKALESLDSKFYPTEVIYIAPQHSDWPIYCDTLLAYRDWADGDLTADSMTNLSDAEVGCGVTDFGTLIASGPSLTVLGFLCVLVFVTSAFFHQPMITFCFSCSDPAGGFVVSGAVVLRLEAGAWQDAFQCSHL